ncbi:unnamed protein product [Dicrocoelium dendriticum]|nr:unnamed protein product [Dicrocoelium dendriticum]
MPKSTWNSRENRASSISSIDTNVTVEDTSEIPGYSVPIDATSSDYELCSKNPTVCAAKSESRLQRTNIFSYIKHKLSNIFNETKEDNNSNDVRRNVTPLEDRKTVANLRISQTTYITKGVPSDISYMRKRYEDSLIRLTSLTDEEIASVRASWAFLKTHIEKIGVIIFLGLFEEHSDFRDAFAQFRGKQLTEINTDPALQAHGLRVLNIVDKLITRIHKIEAIQEYILQLGSKHCRYVPNFSLIPNVGEQLVESIEPILKEKGMWTPETISGWNTLMNFLTSAMSYGLARTPRI